MIALKKYAMPAVVSLAAVISAQVRAQDDSSLSFGQGQNSQQLQVQSSTLNSFNSQAHPLAKNIIVKYKPVNKSVSIKHAESKTAALSKKIGVPLTFKRMMSGDAEVLSISSTNKSAPVDIQAIVESINNQPDVEYAEIDAWVIAYRTPNDSRYNEQWHYKNSAGGMNLPGAWDETTGSSSVTVAVLDTGYRPHSDLAGNVVGQYDMISSTSVSNDGNGRDSNAQDPGDWVTANQCGNNDAADSSWHGTHVAGTVAAVSDNGSGVAGVAWNVNLVPVRVLGTCGGSLSDIADGIRWAAGLSVSGVPTNANPADVINMSLGSSSPAACSSTYSSAINAAVNAGTTIVVAAGNDNSSAGYPPGNCPNVISVAAGANDGARAYYSNFGSAIDITAPGGDGCNPTSNSAPTTLSDCQGGVWDATRMILSTHNSGSTTPGSNNYDWLQGTSMASPHVAGLAALIKSVDGSLTPAQIEQAIKDNASAFANVGDHQCTTSICGAGYADAAATIAAVSPSNPVNVAPTASFTSSCTNLVCSFNGSGSTDSDGTIASYSWSFGGSGSTANNTFAAAGTYSVTLTVTDNDGATDTDTQSVSVTAAPPTGGNVLTNGVAKTGLQGPKDDQKRYTMVVPSGATDLSFSMSGGSGDADLYVKFGSAPGTTSGSYECRSWATGNTETCNISNVQAGTYHVLVDAYAAYSGASLTGSFTEPSTGGGETFFQNTSNVNIPDNNSTGITSDINVTRTGNAGTVEVKFEIVHTYRGDLEVFLETPSGLSATLRNRSGGSANNLSMTVSVNASSENNANGIWKLRVKDRAGQDVGYIDSWSIEFQ